MQIQIVRIFECIINTVLAIIRNESVSEIVSKKSLLIHTALQTALSLVKYDRAVKNDHMVKNYQMVEMTFGE